MPRTRVFRSGNSQAVRIPTELAYADMSVDLEITRRLAEHDGAVRLSALSLAELA
jgi:antitoxin component of MazEF toxin-antitoxin module